MKEGLRLYGSQTIKLQIIPDNTKYNFLTKRRRELNFQACVGAVKVREVLTTI